MCIRDRAYAVSRQNSTWYDEEMRFEFGSVRHGSHTEETGASDTSAHREGAAKGPRKVCTYLSSQFVLNSKAIVFEADFRRPDDNDDADRQALASMRLRSVY